MDSRNSERQSPKVRNVNNVTYLSADGSRGRHPELCVTNFTRIFHFSNWERQLTSH